MGERPGARWWQLYVVLPLLVGLLWLEMQIPFTPTEDIIAQLGILCLIFGFTRLWLHANRSALMHLDEQEGKRRIGVDEIPPVSLQTFDEVEEPASERPMLHIPAAGLKGVLSNTFEWEPPEDPAVPRSKGPDSGKE